MSQQMPALGRPPSAAPNGGTITGQQQTVGMGQGQQGVPGVEVQFRTAKGLLGSVFVPNSIYSAANAIAAARAAANEMDAAHGAPI